MAKTIPKKELTAKDIYDILINDEKLIGEKGNILFSLKGISVTIKSKDVIGNIIQDWFAGWLDSKGIYYSLPTNTQKFPDFHLSKGNSQIGLLEIKAFDRNAGPNFDIANFESYCRSLKSNAYRLDADYLIFGYQMDSSFDIEISDIWLKKIWEISGSSEAYPVKIQQKQAIIYNLRPSNWYSNGKLRYPPFKSKVEFVLALNDTLNKYPKTKPTSKGWLKVVNENYRLFSKVDLVKTI
ncbi:MAG: restriction endonuclease [Candidatus Diapherotrites archaeon CG11_big_fil_rev_8_21_14_0_20_37_9]|nr:MAG: restriction endonuclease [Candidatus Diapherotrites archaeon CG11_big_fil_rev_8_21_14_0_20_37_9]